MSYNLNSKIKQKVQNFKCHNAGGQGIKMGHSAFLLAHYACFYLPINTLQL